MTFRTNNAMQSTHIADEPLQNGDKHDVQLKLIVVLRQNPTFYIFFDWFTERDDV